MHSPSGHTAFSILVYGALTLATAMQSGGLQRLRAIGIGIGIGLILTIAASRLLLDVHSLAEIGLGMVIGAASLALFARKFRQYPQAKLWPLLVAATLLMTLLHGHEFHAEESLHRITGYLQVSCS